MLIKKELKDIAWDVPESEYRADPALSYSTLATYERSGYNGLDHLFDKKESPSLLLGSIVDCLITGSQEEFDSLYFVADIPALGDKEKLVADYLLANYRENYAEMQYIPATYVLEAANIYEFQKNWREDTRVKVLTERCSPYYNVMLSSEGKTFVDRKTYEDAINMVRALKTSPATCGYFADNDEFSPIRRYYQLKFKAILDEVAYRCMADLICVDYEAKKIYPVDLKTSSKPEWNFEESFLQWSYMIQSRLYWRVIKANIEKDPYFKGFTLEDYKFIVVNKYTLTPLVWEFPLTKSVGTLIDDNGKEYRDPYEIGKELRAYLDCKPPVPNGINKDGVNIINCIKKK